MILEDATAVAAAATWRALHAALAHYRAVTVELGELLQQPSCNHAAGDDGLRLVQTARRQVQTCWALHFGRPCEPLDATSAMNTAPWRLPPETGGECRRSDPPIGDR